ncbi:MAG: ABC transporter permease [Lachnospirales bacterium]
MNFGQSFRLAIKSLLTSKMRALLTMLGIIIGVAAVIIITSLGNGMKNYMNKQFDQLGANLIQVQITGRGGGTMSSRSVDPADMYALVDKYPGYLSGVSPYVRTVGTVRHGSDEYTRTSTYGVSEFYYDASRNQAMSGEKLETGRFLTYIDVSRRQNVCVIGSYLAQEAFQGNAIGKTLTIQGSPFTVVGVLSEKADSTAGSGDDVIFIPYENAMTLNGSGSVNFYLFNSTSKDTSAPAKGIIENKLFKVFQDEDTYFVMSSAEMLDAMNSMLNTLMAILILIAAISLLVGGIGIMNIMLVSVTERTREIGVRKSLGAKRKDIRSQFIIEAGTTSAVGGVIGIVLGIIMANILTNVIAFVLKTGNDGFVAIPTLTGIAVSFGVSVGVGILFGYLPANKAARLNPIDALRYD